MTLVANAPVQVVERTEEEKETVRQTIETGIASLKKETEVSRLDRGKRSVVGIVGSYESDGYITDLEALEYKEQIELIEL